MLQDLYVSLLIKVLKCIGMQNPVKEAAMCRAPLYLCLLASLPTLKHSLTQSHFIQNTAGCLNFSANQLLTFESQTLSHKISAFLFFKLALPRSWLAGYPLEQNIWSSPDSVHPASLSPTSQQALVHVHSSDSWGFCVAAFSPLPPLAGVCCCASSPL